MSTPVTNTTHSAPPNFLHWSQRPPELVDTIDRAFQAISGQFFSGWGMFNGSESYGICGVKEHELMKRLILEAPAGQKDFYALEIGAGNFQWEKGLAEYLNKQTDLPSDIRIHIIGIRGEQYLGDAVEERGRCKIYRLGAFKVEELESEFNKNKFKAMGLDLNNKIDLAASNWCVRHLADPLGTVLQTYHMLRPKTGMLLIDGFFFLYEKQSIYKNVGDQISRINRFFLETRAPFITQFNDGGHCLNHFMLRRPDSSPLQLPMKYDSVGSADKTDHQVGSEAVTCFKVEPQDQSVVFNVVNWPRKDDHLGNKGLHEWLKQNDLLLKPYTAWQPLLASDIPLAQPPLHLAILAKDEAAISQCLKGGCDINESNSFGKISYEQYAALRGDSLTTGRTPLHLALETGNLLLFKALLSQGADATLSDGQGKSALHLAAGKEIYNSFFAEILKTPQRDLNFEILSETPLDSAITGNNLFAIQSLLEKGVIPSYAQNKKLQDAAFSPIHLLLPKTADQRPEFQQIIAHIKAGDTVILSWNDGRGIESIFMPENSKGTITSTNKLVKVMADRQSELLDFDVLKILGNEVGYKRVSYCSTWPQFSYKFEDYAVSTMEFSAPQAMVPPSSVKEDLPALNIRIRGMRLEEGKRD